MSFKYQTVDVTRAVRTTGKVSQITSDVMLYRNFIQCINEVKTQ